MKVFTVFGSFWPFLATFHYHRSKQKSSLSLKLLIDQFSFFKVQKGRFFFLCEVPYFWAFLVTYDCHRSKLKSSLSSKFSTDKFSFFKTLKKWLNFLCSTLFRVIYPEILKSSCWNPNILLMLYHPPELFSIKSIENNILWKLRSLSTKCKLDWECVLTG